MAHIKKKKKLKEKRWSIEASRSMTGLDWKALVLVAQSCPTPCDPVDCNSVAGSSVCGILQARILE